MPWKECAALDQRLEFVRLARNPDCNVRELCRRFGISPKTAYKWKKRYEQGGAAGLLDRSRKPASSPVRACDAVEAAVLEIREEHPAWGGRKIRRVLERDRLIAAEQLPSASTVTRILHRHGRITPEASRSAKPLQRFERPEPNDLWQMDFKGYHLTADQKRCDPLTITDDHSRFNVCLAACTDQMTETVRDQLIRCFQLYGLPQQILCDNGVPWCSSSAPGGWSRLSVWLLRLDVSVTHGRPYHPQTQGKEERFHRTLKVEVLQGRQARNAGEQQADFDTWREIYNHRRPHDALGLAVPSDRYRPSDRRYPERLPDIEYDHGEETRKVGSTGRVHYGTRVFKLSAAFAGERVAIRGTERSSVKKVVFARQAIGLLDVERGLVLRRPGSAGDAFEAADLGPPPERE